ncbi:MAG: biotin carboxylase N-terminal domain-containing protein [Pseudomonadales bacterium]|nr:biotin carboxylase N-terminal domain-containing protein [Pseudomonadales bacterium]MDG1444274.1 biotin carboxylase N-terminal domain-containing protein [Pseudomonadales bacterium]
MIKRVLIANRGEIALRILRACQAAGVETVAAYSKTDRLLRHLRYADDTICIGESSYLSIDDLIMAATLTGCDAVHPGYGFLSEDAELVDAVEKAGLHFIGPSAATMRVLGNKSEAKNVFEKLGLQPIPGSDGLITDVSTLADVADQVGYPILIKAAYGGGGRGIRLVENPEQLGLAFDVSTAEAIGNFGRAGVYVERYFALARHIEVQLLGDGQGNAIHLGTRDCSIQRRNQKLVEEAPAPGLSAQVLDEIAQRAARALAKLNYRNAATMEFLCSEGQFYFMEINTRIQVEHPVTEMFCNVDLIQAQLSVAESDCLPVTQSQISPLGCSIECRVLAEDVDYQPSPGTISKLELPGGPGVRVDSHLYSGYTVPHQYDSLIAKIITAGRTRQEALRRMTQALSETRIEGIETNLALLLTILKEDDFREGRYHIRFMNRYTDGLQTAP